MDRSQIAAADNARQSEFQVELSHISVSLEFECFLENGCDKGNKILTMTFYRDLSRFLGTFLFCIFLDETSVNGERWEGAVFTRRTFLVTRFNKIL